MGQERAVEAPQIQTCEVLKQVATAPQQRIIQTGVQWEQAVAREAVVEGVGAMQYAGAYNAGVVGVSQGGVVNVQPVVTRGETIVEPMIEHLRAVQTGPIGAREGVQPIRTEYMPGGTTVIDVIQPRTGAVIEYVNHGGQQLAFHEGHPLITWPPTKLREHALHLYRTLGHHVIGTAVPTLDHELHAWISNVQRVHLAPLRTVGGARVLGRTGVVGGSLGASSGARVLGGTGVVGGYLGASGGARVLGGTGVIGGAPRVIGGTGVIGGGGVVQPATVLKAGSMTDDLFNVVDRNMDGKISRSEFRSGLKGGVINAGPAAVLPGLRR